jgi:hypothetical protein
MRWRKWFAEKSESGFEGFDDFGEGVIWVA